ncbi:LytTR family DNA-binding domain-containing protein [Flammeovirga pectinis]|nr:LytTR family DNA-binding domain-containing protein [Flammeovirga pectinis]
MNNLNAPFPLLQSNKVKFISSFSFGFFVFVFLYIFQPFGINEVQFYKPLFIGGYALITFSCVAFSFFGLPLLFKNTFNPDKWTVKKAALYTSFIILIISVGNWYYTATIGQEVISLKHSFLKFIGITFSVGIFPTVIFLIFTEKTLRKVNESKAGNITKQIHTDLEIEEEKQENDIIPQIDFLADNNSIPLNQLNFLCIKSEGNYLEVFFFIDGKLNKSVIRYPLKKAFEQVNELNNIHHCHRSFIANFDQIEKVSGNARNYELHLRNLTFTIPVSRGFSKDLIAIYK